MKISDYSINVSQNLFYSETEESATFVYLFTTSNTESEVNPIVFVF